MAKKMKVCAGIAILSTVICAVLYGHTHTSLFLILAITFGTTAYHFAMRLLVGTVINRLLHNRVNHRIKWFQVSATERKLYKKLNIQKWKSKVQSYDPSAFDRNLHSWDEITQAMCQAELVHEVIIALSFIPIFAAILFGALWVFVITSVLSACIDAAFVMIQRYNRPRIIKFIENSAKKHLKNPTQGN